MVFARCAPKNKGQTMRHTSNDKKIVRLVNKIHALYNRLDAVTKRKKSIAAEIFRIEKEIEILELREC